MTYQIITLNEKEKSRAVWYTFTFPADSKSTARTVSFFDYLKNGTKTLSGFFVHELETDKAVPAERAFPVILEKLKNFPALA